MLIHQQNSHAPRSKQRTARREAQIRELVKLLNKDHVVYNSFFGLISQQFRKKKF
jgi:hypothetical protein